ncbi:Riboflavin transporter FmnP [Caloramator fervidus]|uniref:Riboflavin transporter n=1 Tax=Caloramator fervidus TaxID=29344 RepID=A0A1H5RMT2_9CLOT|nr:ECF transporter S component [Caloramator fervidus]SEF39676.1 Riboflavin transporter FmnP [Caloramator fervidus]
MVKSKKLSNMIKVSILSAISLILMFFEFSLPIFPEFLKIDLSDIPPLLGAFALGPLYGVLVEFIKNILHFVLKGQTAGIGEMANFLVGISLVYPASYIYFKNKTKKGAFLGLFIGVVVMVISASLLNYFVLLPLYEKVLNFPISAIIEWASKVNKNIKDINSLIVYSIAPFNLIKGVIVSFLTILIYKRVSPILHK